MRTAAAAPGMVALALSMGCAEGGFEVDPPVKGADAAGGETAAEVGREADAAASADAARPLDVSAATDTGPGPDGGGGAPGVRFVGRVDRSDPARARFTWSGTTVLARFTGSSIGVRLTDMANRFEVVLDGKPLPALVGRFGVEEHRLGANLGPGPHELSIVRLTEAWLGETEFRGLVLAPEGALLPPPPPAARRLEFVGDSITCGYGVEGADQHCPFSPATENHALSFAALAARALSAESVAVAYSGKGMYRNLDGGMTETMPQLYDRTLVGRPGAWSFASWIPDAVVINLGTNDFGRGDPGQGYGDAYQAFVRRVRAHYPGAHILCTLGPMMAAAQVARARGYIMPIVEAARAAGDLRVSYLEFAPQDGSTGFGCDWHPSRGTHQAMAETLTAELRRLLGW